MNLLFYKWKSKLILSHFKLKYIYKTYFYLHLKVIFTLSGLFSIFIFLLTYGTFYIDSELKMIKVSYIIQIISYYFIFYEFINLLFYRENVEEGIFDYIRIRKIEILIFAILAILIPGKSYFLKWIPTSLPEIKLNLLYLTLIQILIFINNFFHFSRNISNLKYKMINPSLVIFLSFITVMGLGVILLSLPKFHTKSHELIDIVFTIVSATCVTGLTTLDIASNFTHLGQTIILIWIQLGGLGIMTLTSFFSYYFSGKVSLTNQILMKELFSEVSLDKVKKIIRDITIYTFVIEFLGAFFLYLTLPDHIIPKNSSKIFYAIFHSISAFCNAGFSLFSDSLYSLSLHSKTPIYIIMILVILGGIGFTVIEDIISKFLDKKYRISLTTKIILLTNAILWISGVSIFLIFSRIYQLSEKFQLNNFDLITHGLFFSITPRTAGFNTLPYNELPLPMIFITFLLMWIGASPNSTGGGIKTTTFTVAILHIISILTGTKNVQIFYSKINEEVIMRSYTSVMLSLTTIFAGIFLLTIFESMDFLKISFEVVSAYGTVGLSLGITPEISSMSKMILAIIMFIGRVGILTFMLALIPKQKEKKYIYPNQFVIIG